MLKKMLKIGLAIVAICMIINYTNATLRTSNPKGAEVAILESGDIDPVFQKLTSKFLKL